MTDKNKSNKPDGAPLLPVDLKWKEFFGSSMSLTSGLLDLYDEIQSGVSHRLQSVKSCASGDEESEENLTGVDGNNINTVSESVDKGRLISNQDFILETNDLEMEDYCAVETNPQTSEEVTEVSSCPQAGKLCHKTPLNTDDKKRPLSITSTSSSNSSSTCSLTRHQRKKFANTVGSSPKRATSEEPLAHDDDAFPADALSTVDEYCGQMNCVEDNEELSVDSPSLFVESCDLLTFSRSGLDTTQDEESGEETTGSKASPLGRSCEYLGSNEVNHSVDKEDYVKRPVEDASGMELQGKDYIERLILEIIQSEKSYVNDLKDIILGYMIYMWNTPELNVSKEDMELLFGNIDAIYNFNQRFLCCLENCENSPTEISSCFIRHKDGFNIYSEYCTNYPSSMEVLRKCMKNPCLATAVKQQQLALRHTLPLETYLLKPVQRVMKYHLLLQNMLNNHGGSAAERDVIHGAYAAMLDVAERINEMKRHQELSDDVRGRHVTQLSSSRTAAESSADQQGHDLGHLVLQDKFRMHKTKTPRQVFLFSKALLIGKKKDDGSFSIKTIIQASDLMLIESVPNDPLCFHIVPFSSPKLQYTLQAKDCDQKRLWCQQIKKLILENYNAVIPDKAKELVMELGQSPADGKDDTKAHDKSSESKKRQHCAPEYLERRRSRQKGSFILPDFKLKSRKGSRRSNEHMSGRQCLSPVRKGGGSFVLMQRQISEIDESDLKRQNDRVPTSPTSSASLQSSINFSSSGSNLDHSVNNSIQTLANGKLQSTSKQSSVQTLHSQSASSSCADVNNVNDAVGDFFVENLCEALSTSTPLSVNNMDNERACNTSDSSEIGKIQQPDFEDPWLPRENGSTNTEILKESGTIIPITRLTANSESNFFRSKNSPSNSNQTQERRTVIIPVNVVQSSENSKVRHSYHHSVDLSADTDKKQKRNTCHASDLNKVDLDNKSSIGTPGLEKRTFVNSKQQIEDVCSKQVELKSFLKRSSSKVSSDMKLKTSGSADFSHFSDNEGSVRSGLDWNEPQHRIVQQFNKVYANRKRNDVAAYTKAVKDLTRLLKDGQPGGEVIGSRMAMSVESTPGDMFTLSKNRSSRFMIKSVTDSSLSSNISPIIQLKHNRRSEILSSNSNSDISEGTDTKYAGKQCNINIQILQLPNGLNASVVKLSESLGSLSTSTESMSSSSAGNRSNSASLEQMKAMSATSLISGGSREELDGRRRDSTSQSFPSKDLTPDYQCKMKEIPVLSNNKQENVRSSNSNINTCSNITERSSISTNACGITCNTDSTSIKVTHEHTDSQPDYFYEYQLLGALECLNSSGSTLSLEQDLHFIGPFSTNEKRTDKTSTNQKLGGQISTNEKLVERKKFVIDRQRSLTSIDWMSSSSHVQGILERLHSLPVGEDLKLDVMSARERERRRELTSCASVVRMRRDGLSYVRREQERRRSRSVSIDKSNSMISDDDT